EYLENRNIDVVDFHFLRNTYRAKFQEVSLDHTDEKNPEKFLASWQLQGNIFYLFQSIWNYSKKAYLDCWLFAKHIKKDSHILEYGCSVAPITQGFLKYFGYKNLKFTIADIPQISFLYARWKLSNNANSIEINPSKRDNLPQGVKYNVIFCLTVFEHLSNPLEVVESFFEHLEKGGFLIFDYIEGEATGLDSKQSMQERNNVLKFIERNFKVLKGKIDFEKSMGLTVAKKQ
ncbi:MAG: methyltransferase domain-containing protein, partial [Patescibacteria group bacterium]